MCFYIHLGRKFAEVNFYIGYGIRNRDMISFCSYTNTLSSNHHLLKRLSFLRSAAPAIKLSLTSPLNQGSIRKILLKSRFLSLITDRRWENARWDGGSHQDSGFISSLAEVQAASLAPANRWTLQKHWEWVPWVPSSFKIPCFFTSL